MKITEKKIYSQFGEDGVIESILNDIKPTNKYFVEFGVGTTAKECNTRTLFSNYGWRGLWMDSRSNNNFIKKEFINAENIEKLFEKYKVPNEFDILSIDIDSNDYWVWKAINKYYPRIVIIEYNPSIPVNQSKTIKYDPNIVWDNTDYFGASLLAMKKLGEQKNYKLIYTTEVNAFFIQSNLTTMDVPDINSLYEKRWTKNLYPHDNNRIWVDV